MPINYVPIQALNRWGDITGNVEDQSDLNTALNTLSIIINNKIEKTNPVSDDILLIEDSENGFEKKKIKLSNIAGAGENNNGVNVGTGALLFKEKSGVNLVFRSINSGSNILTISENLDEIEININLSNLDLDSCNNSIARFIKQNEILNEDDFVSESSIFPPTQLSIKNYIDNNTGLANEATPELNNNLLINNHTLVLSHDISNGEYSGIAINGNITINSVGFSCALFLNNSGNYEEASASDIVANKCMGLALESGIGSKQILLNGIIRNDTWSFTPGDSLFLSDTTGNITTMPPNGSGNIVQKLGFAITTNTIYFNPDVTTLELN